MGPKLASYRNLCKRLCSCLEDNQLRSHVGAPQPMKLFSMSIDMNYDLHYHLAAALVSKSDCSTDFDHTSVNFRDQCCHH
mmetsp:Transcript_9892/g.60318  ORF Transcript_9892/g.60318 Transcript_9892/m.60318 type:complete len:80 (-) Transcript_9892:7677-7916(-)